VISSPFSLNKIRVGKLLIPKRFASAFCSVTSTLATVTPLSASPISSHVGANLLQWPHHGAKNLTKMFFPLIEESKLSEPRLRTLESASWTVSGAFGGSGAAAPVCSLINFLNVVISLAPWNLVPSPPSLNLRNKIKKG